jgi:hypothetical protein
MVTDRILQVLTRLQPLSCWGSAGVESICLSRPLMGLPEVKALGAALGSSCRHLKLAGVLKEGPLRALMQAAVTKNFPHVSEAEFEEPV